MATNFDQNGITAYRGDDLAFDVVFADTDGVAINVTGWTLYFTAKINKNDLDTAAVIAKSFTNTTTPTTGIITVSISHTETDTLVGAYFYDIQVKKLDGTIQTVTNGGLTFVKDVTRRTT